MNIVNLATKENQDLINSKLAVDLDAKISSRLASNDARLDKIGTSERFVLTPSDVVRVSLPTLTRFVGQVNSLPAALASAGKVKRIFFFTGGTVRVKAEVKRDGTQVNTYYIAGGETGQTLFTAKVDSDVFAVISEDIIVSTGTSLVIWVGGSNSGGDASIRNLTVCYNAAPTNSFAGGAE